MCYQALIYRNRVHLNCTFLKGSYIVFIVDLDFCVIFHLPFLYIMGTFMGHVLPGSFFIFFGIWHTVNLYIRYFRSKISGKRYRSSTTFPCYLSNYPVEGFLIIFATTIGTIGEIATGYKFVFRSQFNGFVLIIIFTFIVGQIKEELYLAILNM